MALITEDLIEGRIDKVAIAIDRIRAFEPPEGYFVAFSGGWLERKMRSATAKRELHQ